MDIPMSPMSWFRRPRLHVVADEPAPSWQRTIELWDSMREQASTEREREEIDSVFSRHVP